MAANRIKIGNQYNSLPLGDFNLVDTDLVYSPSTDKFFLVNNNPYENPKERTIPQDLAIRWIAVGLAGHKLDNRDYRYQGDIDTTLNDDLDKYKNQKLINFVKEIHKEKARLIQEAKAYDEEDNGWMTPDDYIRQEQEDLIYKLEKLEALEAYNRC